tara:strand:- start:122 stop:607 length:486 start_codon:yes stop_codon:yes gene_type:complete
LIEIFIGDRYGLPRYPQEEKEKKETPTQMKTYELERFAYHPDGTMGSMLVGDQRFYSIERPWLENAPNVSCIPEGTYSVGWRESPRFGETWHIQDVPGRTHILIHAANFPHDVEGCIGLGTRTMDAKIAVGSSRRGVKLFEDLTRGAEWQLKIVSAKFAGL